MADITFRNILISFVFFSLIITGVVVAITQTSSDYPALVNASGNFSAINFVGDLDRLNVLTNLSGTTDSLSAKLANLGNSTSWQVTAFGYLTLSAEALGAFINIAFTSATIPFAVVGNIWSILPLPDWLKTGIVMIITLTFLFLLMQVILKQPS